MTAKPDEWNEELFQRAAAVWRLAVPSEDETERAWRTFSRRHARPARRGRLVLVAAAQGFVLGLVTIATATWVRMDVLPQLAARSATSPAASPAPRAGGRRAAPPPSAPSVHDAVEPASTATFDDVAHGSASQIETVTPSVAKNLPPRALPQARREARAWGFASPPPSDIPSLAAGEGPWERVARALADHDIDRADRALAELCRSAEPSVRDAAELARAELWIGNGRGAAFGPALQRLATSGQTPFVRQRAAALLSAMK